MHESITTDTRSPQAAPGSRVDELCQGEHHLLLWLNDSSNIQKSIGSYLITTAWLESQMPGRSQRSSSPPLIDETAEKKRRMRRTPVTL
jgi:hypothetical protein